MIVIEKLRSYWSFAFIGLFFLVTLVYIGVRGDNIYLPEWDALDQYPAIMKMMQDNGLFSDPSREIPFLGGISRNHIYPETKLQTWVMMVLPPFWTLVVSWYFKIIAAIVGFCWLGHILKIAPEHINVVALCGFIYGIIPSHPNSDFAFGSLPILLCLLILIYRKFSWKYLLALLMYPVASDFPLFGFFICAYVGLFFMALSTYRRQPVWRMLVACVALSVGYIATDFRLFELMFFGEPSLRKGFMLDFVSLGDGLRLFYSGFTAAIPHTADDHKYVILPVMLIYILYMTLRRWRNKDLAAVKRDPINWLLGLILVNSLIYGLDMVAGFRSVLAGLVPALEGFNFGRTLWMNGALWYVAFMLVLVRLPWRKCQVVLLLLAFIVVCLAPAPYNQIRENLFWPLRQMIKGHEPAVLNYHEFYAEKLFAKIKTDIGYAGEWSVAYGMHPSVVNYNNIRTLDGYLSFYPLSYKEKFRRIIAPTLATDEVHRKYFDNWGGRAYIFSPDVPYYPGRKLPVEVAELNIDTAAFSELGGKYVFSRVLVTNAAQIGLRAIGSYTDDESPYIIYVYAADL